MVESGALDCGQAPDAAGEVAAPKCRIPKRLRLGTLRDVRREMAHVYADMRRGLLPAATGARFVYVLDKMRTAVVADELEGRIVALEAKSREATS
jgi:hypothetical protein